MGEKVIDSSLDDKLLDLTTDTNEEKNKEEYITPNLPTAETTKEDIQDLVNVNSPSKPLSDKDYLILADYSEGVQLGVICKKHTITKTYIDSLIRRQPSLDFLKKVNDVKQVQTVNRLSAITNTVIEKKVDKINEYMVNGQEGIAFMDMFGKLSMIEVLEKMNKLQDKDKDEDGDRTLNFLQVVTGR